MEVGEAQKPSPRFAFNVTLTWHIRERQVMHDATVVAVSSKKLVGEWPDSVSVFSELSTAVKLVVIMVCAARH